MSVCLVEKRRPIWLAGEREAWRPVFFERLSEWAEASIVLPESTPEPGPLRLDRTPYAVAPLDAISSPWVEQVTLPSAAQMFKTTMELVLMGWIIDQQSMPALFLMGREEDAVVISRDRMRPIIEASPVLRQYVNLGKDGLPLWNRQITANRISLNGADIYFDTMNSAAAVASKPIFCIVFDELHLMKASLKSEGDAVTLGRKRVSNYDGGKVVLTSTRTDSQARISTEYMLGTQEEWNNRCPHCRGLYVPEFSGIRVPPGERNPQRIRGEKLAWYECGLCGARITELEKNSALAGGEYVARNPQGARAPHRSFQISGICSPFPRRSFSHIMAEFLEADGIQEPRARYEALQAFYNTTLGLNFDRNIQSIRVGEREDRIGLGALPRGVLPAETQLLTCGADWHAEKKGLFWVVFAFGAGPRGWLVDCGNVFSEADLEEAFFGKAWAVDGSDVFFRPRGGVDSAYRTSEVYKWCRPFFPGLRPTKGEDEIKGAPYRESGIEYTDKRTGERFKGFSLLRINTSYYKEMLSTWLEDDGSGGDGQGVSRLGFFRETPEEYFTHLGNEVKRRVSGKDVWMPKYGGAPNHYLDATVIAFAVAERFGLLRLQGRRQELKVPREERGAGSMPGFSEYRRH